MNVSKTGVFLPEAKKISFDEAAILRLIDIIANLPNDAAGGRKGGTLALYDTGIEFMAARQFGEFPLALYPDPIARMKDTFRNATEKVTRILVNRHYRSMTTRNVEKKEYGGGIRYGSIICAFSGFLEEHDEALSFVYAMYLFNKDVCNWTKLRAYAIIHQSQYFADNKWIEVVLDEFKDFYESSVIDN